MNFFTRLFSSPKIQKKEEEINYNLLPSTTLSLNDIFVETIKEVERETYKQEFELLQDDKLAEYLRAAVKYMAANLNKDTYSFILIHPRDLKIPANIFATFCEIARKVFKEYGINIDLSSPGYLRVEKLEVNKCFKSLRTTSIDIDERVRAMLSRGVYR